MQRKEKKKKRASYFCVCPVPLSHFALLNRDLRLTHVMRGNCNQLLATTLVLIPLSLPLDASTLLLAEHACAQETTDSASTQLTGDT